jgi:hypothetical protein
MLILLPKTGGDKRMNIVGEHLNHDPLQLFKGIHQNRSVVLLSLSLSVFVSFEIFNFSVSFFALNNLPGGINDWGIRWAVILAIVFCIIDFGGIALYNLKERAGRKSRLPGWLFGIWMAGASLNTLLIWWGLSIAIAIQPVGKARMVDTQILAILIPVSMAVLAGLIRILFTGTLAASLAGTNMLAGRQQTSVSRAQLRRLVVPSRAGCSARLIPRPLGHSTGIEIRASRTGTPVDLRGDFPGTTCDNPGDPQSNALSIKSTRIVSESRRI